MVLLMESELEARSGTTANDISVSTALACFWTLAPTMPNAGPVWAWASAGARPIAANIVASIATTITTHRAEFRMPGARIAYLFLARFENAVMMAAMPGRRK
ncbi:hypothetical protein D3C85_1539210 [compost metagenome]